jgi:hypothetical protein
VAVTLGASVLTFGALASACANRDTNQVTSPVVVGMSETIAPYYSDGQTTIYQVEKEVPLPMRPPTAAERNALGEADPFPRAPFLRACDVRLEIRFTLTNLDDKQHSIELLIDPWNEFVRYHPLVQVVNDEQSTPDLSGYDKFFVVPPKSRVEGTITPDDTNELAVDLATAMNATAHPPTSGAGTRLNALINHIFNLQNRSNDGDPLVTPLVPGTIPGLSGFDLGIRSYEPVNVAVEIIVDVTDLDGDRTIPFGKTDEPMGVPPDELSPPATSAM